jgi:DNA replication protein DnaC
LRLPSMSREVERLARDAAATNQNYFEFLLRLTESELATRAAAAISRRIKDAKFPVLKGDSSLISTWSEATASLFGLES